jgi:hypothetical protein
LNPWIETRELYPKNLVVDDVRDPSASTSDYVESRYIMSQKDEMYQFSRHTSTVQATSSTMKVAILSALVGSAVAFVPASKVCLSVVSTELSSRDAEMMANRLVIFQGPGFFRPITLFLGMISPLFTVLCSPLIFSPLELQDAGKHSSFR